MRLIEIHIEVGDIKKSLDLYTKLFPHKKVKHWEDGSAAALVFEDGSAFGIWKKHKLGVHKGRGGAHVHFAFQIKNEQYDYYLNLITNLGLEPLEYTWPNKNRSLYFFDYDGNQGEFMTTDWSTG